MLKYKDLIDRLTIEQKISLITSNNFYKTNTLEAFDIPSIRISKFKSQKGKYTFFPTKESLARTWNLNLIKKVGILEALESQESNVLVEIGESFSKDFFLKGAMTSSYITGIQSTGTNAFFHGLPEYGNDLKLFRENEFQPYETLLTEGKPSGIIIEAKNKVEKLPYEGIIFASDENEENIVLNIINGSCCTFSNSENTFNIIFNALKTYNEAHPDKLDDLIKQGLALDENILDSRIDSLLGFICLQNKNRISDELISIEGKLSSFNEPLHEETAIKAEQEGIVLLKNSNILPLNPFIKVALIGEAAKNTFDEMDAIPTRNESFFDAISNHDCNIIGYAHGYSHANNNKSLTEIAKSLVKDSEVCILHLKVDEETKELPKNQLDLLLNLYETKVNIIVVLEGPLPNDMGWNKYCSAILSIYGGSQALGKSLSNIIFGDISPSGRLVEGYNDNNGTLYPFGYGLTYAKIIYSNLVVNEIGIELTVKNTSNIDSYEVVQLYTPEYETEKRLRGFNKVFVRANSSERVFIPFDNKIFTFFDIETDSFLTIGKEHKLLIGGSRDDIMLEASIWIDANKNVDISNELLPEKSLKNALNDFSNEEARRYNHEEIFGMSLSKKLIITFVIAIYYNLILGYLLNIFSSNTIGVIILACLIGLFDLGVILFTVFAIIKRKPKPIIGANDTLTKLIDNVGSFNEVSRIVYEQPVPEKEEDEEDVAQPILEEKNEYVFEKVKSMQTQIEIEDEINFEELISSLNAFIHSKGIGVDVSSLKIFLASILSSKIIYITSSTVALVPKLIEVISEYFKGDFFRTDLNSSNSFNDLFWILENETQNYIPTGISKALNNASVSPQTLNFSLIENPTQPLNKYLNLLINDQTIELDNGNEFKSPDNLWNVIIIDEISNLNENILRFSSVIDLTIQEIETVVENEYKTVQIQSFINEIDTIKEQFYISEDSWKKIDELEETISNNEKFKIGNKLLLQLETFSSVLVAFDIEEILVIDNILVSRILPLIKSMNFYQNDKANRLLKEVIEKIFDLENIPLTNKTLKKK